MIRIDQTPAERKCRMALESIRNGYRRPRTSQHVSRRRINDIEEAIFNCLGSRSPLLQSHSKKERD